MAATYAQAGTAASFAAAVDVTVALPATVVDGEIAICRVPISTLGSVTSWPAGWSEMFNESQGTDFSFAAAWHRCVASDGGTSIVVPLTALPTGGARIVTYLGCALTGTPYEALATNKGTSTTASSTSMATLGRNRLGVLMTAYDRVGARTASPSGWTEDLSGAVNNTRTYHDSKVVPYATTEGVVSSTLTSDDWVTATFALLPQRFRSSVFAVG